MELEVNWPTFTTCGLAVRKSWIQSQSKEVMPRSESLTASLVGTIVLKAETIIAWAHPLQILFNFCIMTLCNFSAYLHYGGGTFYVNVYIDMKTEVKIVVYFINFLTPGKRVHTHRSEFVGRCANFPVKFVLINPTFCVGSCVRLFQGRFVRTQRL